MSHKEIQQNDCKATQIIKPSKSVYFVWFSIFTPLAALTLIMFYFNKVNVYALYACGLCIFFLSVLCAWTSIHTIKLTKNSIIFLNIKILQRAMTLDEIYDWYTWIGLRDDHGHTGPFVRLVIEPKPESGKKAIILPLKFYTEADFQRLKKFLDQVPTPPKTED
jgi:hypothetical protein